MRASGILMHISSLPGKYGIGDFGQEAYTFVDFLVKAKQKVWQILPFGIGGYGNSPYQSFSVFAGNPYFIDLDELFDKGFLNIKNLMDLDFGRSSDYIDYEKLHHNKMELLRTAYSNARESMYEELEDFFNSHIWLREFSLYMTIKEKSNNRSWIFWDKELRSRNPAYIREFIKNNKDEIFFWVFTQYFFMNQWQRLKSYANKQGIQILGDLPIYAALDSADIWANPEYFNLDKDFLPVSIAGCPPDYFSKTGQLWGNPTYNWNQLEEWGYKWWIYRIQHSFHLFDILRIDHFRGFESYWEVPYGSKNAINGKWVKGPGQKFFNRVEKELGDLKIIAEDLGFLTKEVKELIKYTGYPGMKVLQFAFNPNENSDYLPHNYEKNCVVYTGTHDNNTVLGWLEGIPKEEHDFAVQYLKLDADEGYNWGLIRGAWSSVADLAIAPIQDFLGLGGEGRINTPSTTKDNWIWRVDKSHITDSLAEKIATLTTIYRR